MTRHVYDHPRPAVAVDLVLFGIVEQRLVVLRGRRAAAPHKGRACLPGAYVRETESADEACARKIASVASRARCALCRSIAPRGIRRLRHDTLNVG